MFKKTAMNTTEIGIGPEVPKQTRLLCGKPLWGVMLVLALLTGACSPAYNWRTWRSPSTPLQGMMPCKPDVAQREVPLEQRSVTLNLHSCDNEGLRFALAWVSLPAGGDTAAFMGQWQQASAHALKATAPALSINRPAVSGAMNSAWWSMQGQDHRGHTIQSQVVYFSDAQHVYQAAIYGPPWQDETVAPFWEGLKLP
jgi:hypothetical protein